MKRRTRLTSNQEQETESNQSQKQTPVEFESPEELLRYEASLTDVPPSIAERLQESLAQQSGAQRPWWKRWLGKE